MARYAINTADPPITEDITKCVSVAERHISAQLAAKSSLNRRDAIAPCFFAGLDRKNGEPALSIYR